MLRVLEKPARPSAPFRYDRHYIESLSASAAQAVTVRTPRTISTETELSQGRILVHSPHPDFYFGAYDLDYLQDNAIEVAESPSLFCGLLLSGSASTLDIAGHGSFELRVGAPVIVNFAEPVDCHGLCKAGTHCSGIGIRLTRDFFDSGFSTTASSALRSLRSLMDGETSVRTLRGSARLSAIADQAFNGPDDPTLQALYLEGLAFAFLAELARIESEDGETFGSAAIKPHEMQRVHRVAEVLDQSLEEAPRLGDLARLAGINATTLSRQFQAVYGETIFEYLRSRRLDRARALLRSGSMNVSQVGYAVGFSSAAAFATSYRRRFGHPPSRESLQA